MPAEDILRGYRYPASEAGQRGAIEPFSGRRHGVEPSRQWAASALRESEPQE